MAEGMRYPEGSPFPPIAEYAFLSDRDVNALVARAASRWRTGS